MSQVTIPLDELGPGVMFDPKSESLTFDAKNARMVIPQMFETVSDLHKNLIAPAFGSDNGPVDASVTPAESSSRRGRG